MLLTTEHKISSLYTSRVCLVQWCNASQLCSLSRSPGISRAISGRDGHSRNSSALTCILGKESRWRQGHTQNIFLLKGPPTPYKRGIRSGHKHHCGKGVSYHVSYLLLNAFFLGEDSVQGCKTPRLQLAPRHRGAQPNFVPPQPSCTDIHHCHSHWTSRITDTWTDFSRASLHVKVTPLSDSVTGDTQMLLMFTLFPSFRSTFPPPRYQSSSSAWLLFCTRQERETERPGNVDREKSAAWLFTDSSKPAEEGERGH